MLCKMMLSLYHYHAVIRNRMGSPFLYCLMFRLLVLASILLAFIINFCMCPLWHYSQSLYFTILFSPFFIFCLFVFVFYFYFLNISPLIFFRLCKIHPDPHFKITNFLKDLQTSIQIK